MAADAMNIYNGIGVMSGTSLDGLDIAFCRFEHSNHKWKYRIMHADTIAYSADFRSKLENVYSDSAAALALMHHDLGSFIGREVKKFIDKHKAIPDFIASHGHTVFHRPEYGLTFQIGDGAKISAATTLPVISDFRTMDVAFGGQGAPLVPAGDKFLFSEYDMCLNLGGIANISFSQHNNKIAFDICPVNMVLNALSLKEGKPYDDKGQMAAQGNLLPELLYHLNKLPYYTAKYPKSIGKEWVDHQIFPLLKSKGNKDMLHTFCHHIATQINQAAAEAACEKNAKVLVTGGGAFNTYLLELMKQSKPANIQYEIPDEKTIMFKEALIFAFLGVLRIRNEYNAFSSVTGATQDSTGGAIYGNFAGLK